MKATTVAAVGAAFVIAGLPREAAAAKLVFDVTITHVLGLPVPGFTPISFQQTVIGTFNTQAEYDSTSGPLTARINRAFFEGIKFSDSPLSDDLRAFAALPQSELQADQAFQAYVISNVAYTSAGIIGSDKTVQLVRVLNQTGPTVDGQQSIQFYTQQISGTQHNGAPIEGPMTPRTALALLVSMGPIGWSETGANGVYDNNTRQYVSGGYYNYQGTATLNAGLSVVPEPGAWALMILGFAGAGLAVRRRTATAA